MMCASATSNDKHNFVKIRTWPGRDDARCNIHSFGLVIGNEAWSREVLSRFLYDTNIS